MADKKPDRESSKIEIDKNLIRESEKYISWGSWELDRETGQFYCSPQVYEILGWPPEKPFDREDLRNLIHPDERDEKIGEMQQTIEDKGGFDMEMRLKREDGTVRHIRSQAHVIDNPEEESNRLSGIMQDVTDLKEKETDLKEEIAFNKALLEATSDGYMLISMKTDAILDVNPAYCEMTGYSRKELLNMTINDLDVEIQHGNLKEETGRIVEKGAGSFETKHRKRSGEIVNVEISLTVLSKGDKDFVAAFIRDITDRKEAERKLEEREQRFRSLFKHNPHPVYYFDLEGNFRGMNDKLVEFVGYSREKLMGMNFESFIAEDYLEETKNNFRKAASGIPNEYDIKVIVKDGDGNDVERDIKVTKFPMYVGDEVVGVFGILQDITGRKIAKRALQRSEQRFKSLFEHNPNAVYSLDLEANFLMGNKAMEKLTGYTVGELKEIDFEKLAAPDKLESLWEKFEAVASGNPQTFETAAIHKKGHRYEVQVTNMPIYIDGKIEGVFGIARDITEEKRAQERLKESEERWQQLVMNNPQPVQIVQEGNIIFINQAGAELFGASDPDELIGKPIIDFSHPDTIKDIKKRKQKLEEGEFIEASEHKIVSLDGSESYVQAHSIPIKYKGKPAIQTVLHDVTDQKKKEQVIKESLDEKEMLLKEIHHRVKNNLAVISGLLELQVMGAEDESTVATLRDSQLRIQSIAMVHEKLYQSEALADIGFDLYLKELVQTISSTYSSAKRTIDIVYDLDSISLDLDQAIPCSLIVNEVVVNCYKHAFDGIQEGKIKITSKYNDRELTIKIKDNGRGIPEDFDVTEYQSLGMTLVQTLADQLNGEIEFSPLNGKESGTVFELKFDTV